MRTLRHLVTALVVVVTALGLSACGDQPGLDDAAGPPAGPSAGAPAGAPLDGDWVLKAGTLDDLILDLSAGQVTLSIDGTNWGGRSACNSYFAEVALDGDAVTLGPVGGTEMGCEEPVMTLEGQYWRALERVTSAARDGDTLTLTGAGVLLEFRPVPAVEPAAVVGTTWTLTTLLERDAASSVIARPALLSLQSNGRLSGSTGCRDFRGQWEPRGKKLVIGPLATTRNACGRAAAPQDKHVLAVLAGTVTVGLDGRALTLHQGTLGLVYDAG